MSFYTSKTSSGGNLHKAGRVRSKFTKQEDIMLINLVNELGTRDWDAIASRMPNRNSRQCKERYLNYLSPNLSHDPWTPEEDLLLETKLKEIGSKWVTISKFFKNRTDTMLKNRWLVLSKRSPHLAGTISNKKHKQQEMQSQTIPIQPIAVSQPITNIPTRNPLPSLSNLVSFKNLSHIMPVEALPQTSSPLDLFDIEHFTQIIKNRPISL